MIIYLLIFAIQKKNWITKIAFKKGLKTDGQANYWSKNDNLIKLTKCNRKGSNLNAN